MEILERKETKHMLHFTIKTQMGNIFRHSVPVTHPNYIIENELYQLEQKVDK